MRYPEYVAEAIDLLEESGHEAYIVGGSVRDMILGKEPNDFDITTSALPEETLEIFKNYRTIPTGLKHGTVSVISQGNMLEITTFRIDGEYKDSRHPESVLFTDDITADLSRRDFTVNAMAYSSLRGLKDPFGGQTDIKNKLIRAVGDPEKRFKEDALRIMRAFRFSAQLGFEIEKETLQAAGKAEKKLSAIARERIACEFLKLICSEDPRNSLVLMKENDILKHIFNNYIPTENIFSSLAKSPASEEIRLGIFMSDAAKSLGKDGVRELLRRLKLSNKLISSSAFIANKIYSKLDGSESDARRFIGECGERCRDTLAAAKALGTLDESFENFIRENLLKNPCTTNKDLAINGGDLVKIGIKGKAVGSTLDKLLELVLESPELNEKEKLIELAKNLN